MGAYQLHTWLRCNHFNCNRCISICLHVPQCFDAVGRATEACQAHKKPVVVTLNLAPPDVARERKVILAIKA